MHLGLGLGLGTQQLTAYQRAISSLYNPANPCPYFIEGWASWHGQNFAVPTGVASIAADSEGERILTLTVTGALGATTLTGTGFDATNGTGSWACSVLHDDGTYGIYTASGITTTSIVVSPPLRAAATAQPLANLGGAFNGQHYGLQGYKALARHIYSQTRQQGYRLRYADKFSAGDTSGWSGVGGINTAVKFAYGLIRNQWPNAGAGSYLNARGRVRFEFDSAIAGQGATRTVSLGGASGYLEAFVGQTTWSGAATRVVVTIDSVGVYDESFTEFRRVVVPFTSATTGTITVTVASSAQTGIAIGDVTWWKYDRSQTWTDKIIDKDSSVVVMGDSWSARYSGGLGAELEQAMADDGGSGSVTTVAQSGQTAAWGLSVFDAQVAPLSPDFVVIEFFTNDQNSLTTSDSGTATWLTNMYSIAAKCQAIGAVPVFVMPLPTQSSAQTSSHGTWTEKIGAGAP